MEKGFGIPKEMKKKSSICLLCGKCAYSSFYENLGQRFGGEYKLQVKGRARNAYFFEVVYTIKSFICGLPVIPATATQPVDQG